MATIVRSALIGLLTGVVPVLASIPAHAQVEPPPQYIPTDEYPAPSARWKLVLGGFGTTAAFYALAQPFSYAWPDAPGGRDLRIPVAGPWMAIANNGCAADNPDCSKFWMWTRGILTALDGLGQAGGLGIALEGIFLHTADDVPEATPAPAGSPRLEQRRDGKPPPKEPAPPTNLFLGPTPIGVGMDGVGITVIGVF